MCDRKVSSNFELLIAHSFSDFCSSTGVIFLTGSIIERIKDDDMELKGYYGFEITHQDLCSGSHHHHDKRVLYCRTEEEREKWVTSLQHAGHVSHLNLFFFLQNILFANVATYLSLLGGANWRRLRYREGVR